MVRSELTRQQWLAIIACICLVPAMALTSSFLNDSVEVDGTITLQPSDSGPQVTFVDLSNEEANLTDPFPDDHTVVFNSTAGNITISSQSETNLNITSIEGSWTNVSNMSESAVDVTINPNDKQSITVDGAKKLNFSSMALDDDTVDFVTESSGTVNITIENIGSGGSVEGVVAYNESGDILDADTTRFSPDATLQINGSQNVSLQSNGGYPPELSNPNPEGRINSFPGSIEVDVGDRDVKVGEEIDVEFELNGNDVGTATLIGNRTVSKSVTLDPGQNKINVTATDVLGESDSLSWTVSTPKNLTIRNVTGSHGIIDDRTINATFFQGDNITEASTSNGNISMTDVPVEDFIVVTLEDNSGKSTEYHNVETLVVDFTEHQTAYMLAENQNSNTVGFTLQDRTAGLFQDNDPMVVVEKPINRSSFSDPQYEMVYSDRFGPDRAAVELESNQRYRVKVRNNEFDVRSVGPIVVDADETIPLSVGQIDLSTDDIDADFEWNVSYDEGSSIDYIRFYYENLEGTTDEVEVQIHEFQNESNTLGLTTVYSGPLQTVSHSEALTGAERNKSWVVDARIEHDGETYNISEPVGSRSEVLTGMSSTLKAIISIGSILLVAGLFSQLNGDFGALVVAAMGGMWWFVGFLPSGTGIGIVVLSMITAALLFIRERGRAV